MMTTNLACTEPEMMVKDDDAQAFLSTHYQARKTGDEPAVMQTVRIFRSKMAVEMDVRVTTKRVLVDAKAEVVHIKPHVTLLNKLMRD